MKIKKVVDERQELELLKIEHIAFWVMYWMLTLSILFQLFIMNYDYKMVLGEIIILLIGSAYIIIGCIIKGQWDYYTQPTLKNYLLYSLGFAALFSIIVGVGKWKQYEVCRENFLGFTLPIVGITFIGYFIVIFIAIYISGSIVKKRRRKLEQEYKDEE